MTFPYQEFAREKMPALLADLKDLIAIDSVRNMDLATPEFPVGPGPAFKQKTSTTMPGSLLLAKATRN